MTVQSTIQTKLTDAFPGAEVIVRDDSHLHQGHVGARPEGETHFHVSVRGPQFEGKSRVMGHRMVMGALKEELAGPVHALAIDAGV